MYLNIPRCACLLLVNTNSDGKISVVTSQIHTLYAQYSPYGLLLIQGKDVLISPANSLNLARKFLEINTTFLEGLACTR